MKERLSIVVRARVGKSWKRELLRFAGRQGKDYATVIREAVQAHIHRTLAGSEIPRAITAQSRCASSQTCATDATYSSAAPIGYVFHFRAQP